MSARTPSTRSDQAAIFALPAIQAAFDAEPTGMHGNTSRARRNWDRTAALIAFVDHHAGEGRERLVESVGRALAVQSQDDPSRWQENWKARAEAAVAALFGEPVG